MASNHTCRFFSVIFSLLLLAGARGGRAQSINSTWICESGNYSETTCWEPLLSVPPGNNGPIVFDVDIPADKGTISMDMNSCEVNSFILGENAVFKILENKSFSVDNMAEIFGAVHCSGGSFIAPIAAFAGDKAQVWVDGGGYVEIVASAYYAAGLSEGSTLMSSDGAGSLLNLSALTELNGSFSQNPYTGTHTIAVRDRGVIDLSGLTKIIGPENYEQLNIEIDNGIIDMSSLQTITGSTGSINFDINHGGILILGDVAAEKASSITLNDPNDQLIAGEDLNLGTTISVSNPGDGTLVLNGDFTYSHTDETKARFGNSYLLFKGDSPHELEVGGYDISVYVDFLANDNFGFGRMVIGESNKSAVVLLEDYINNGNRNGFGGSGEALYLFGKNGEDGLRLLNGSILYMGGLEVYAMLNGEITELITLFDSHEKMIPFDEGWLCLDRPDVRDPRNLIKNGYFEIGNSPPTSGNPVVTLRTGAPDVDYWQISKRTMNWIHESFAADSPFQNGQRYAQISSTETGNGAVSQDVPTEPGDLYYVWFDMTSTPHTDTRAPVLRVSAADGFEEFPAGSAGWRTKTWRFAANGETTTLTFEGVDESSTPFSVCIDNVIVLPEEFNDVVPSYQDLFVQISSITNTSCSVMNLTATVTDANLMAVTDLDESSFSIYVDGELQSVTNVELNTSPISVCLVLDYSGSMSDKAIEDLEVAAETFVRNMYDYDYGEIIKFSTEAQVMQAFTNDKDALIDAIEQPPDFPRVSTSLYDTIYQAISDTAEQTGKKAVIAISDGDDNKSVHTEGDVIDHAVHNGVSVFTIGLGREIDVNDLRIIAERTGGVYYESPTPDELMAIYETISVILKNQYLVTYEVGVCDSDNYDDGEHEVIVIVSRDESYGEDSESFTCPPACNPDTDSDDNIDVNGSS